MKNVLVTGGAGYIGSHVVEALIKRGFKVFIVDNLSTGYKKLINKKAKFYNLDVNNFKKVKKKLIENNIDSVIHLAASLDVNESEKYPKKYFHNNVNGTLNLIKSIKNSKVLIPLKAVFHYFFFIMGLLISPTTVQLYAISPVFLESENGSVIN